MPVFNATRFAKRLFADWLARQRRLRERKFHVVRLEDRRLPDASFALVGSALTLDGFDGGDSLTANQNTLAGEFSFELETGIWDVTDLAGGPFALSNGDRTLTVAIAALDSISIDASLAPLTDVNDGPGGLSAGSLQIQGGGSVTLDAAATDFDSVNVAADDVTLTDADELEITALDVTDSLTITTGGALTDVAGTSIAVGGHANLTATSITLGDDAADVVNFDSLTIVATGDVEITEDSDTNLTGANSADRWTVRGGTVVDLDGSLNASSLVIESGSEFSGRGVVTADVTVESGGLLTPDLDPDQLTIVGDADLQSGSTLHIDLAGTVGSPLLSSLDVVGTVTLAGDPDFALDPSLVPNDGDEFIVITNDDTDAIIGTFDDLDELDTVTIGGREFVISYQGGDGNDVSLFAGIPIYDFSASSYAVTETDAGVLTSMVVTLNRSGNTSIASSVDVTIGTPGGAAGAQAGDFVAETITISFAAGQSSATVPVQISGDLIVERDEALVLSLSNFSSGGRAGTAAPTTTLEVTNNDSSVLTIVGVTADEDDGTTTNFVFSVTLSNAVQGGLTVDFATANGSATSSAGPFQDYVAQAGTLNFAGTVGEVHNITVAVTADTWFEATEDFNVSLGTITANDTGIDEATFLSNSGSPATGTITNDDTPILVRFNGANLVISDEVQGGANSHLTLSHDSTTNELVITSTTVNLGTGSAAASSVVRIADALLTGTITELGRAGDDVLVLEFADGSPIVGTGLTFNAGNATSGDGLNIIGSGTQSAVYVPSAATPGSGRITIDMKQVNFIGVEAIDAEQLASLTLSPANGVDVITVANGTDFLNGGTTDRLRLTGSSGGVAITAMAVRDLGLLTIDTTMSDAADTITFASADNAHAVNSLTVNAGAGADVVQINGNVNLDGAVQLSAASIRVNAPNVTTGGSLTFAGATTLQQSTTLTSAATGSAITMDAVSGGGFSLNLNAGSLGDIAIDSVAGVNNLHIIDSANTTITGTTNATNVTIDDTTNAVTFADALTAGSLTTAAQSYSLSILNGGTITTATTLTNTGGVTIGDADSDVLQFTGGLSSTASNNTVRGTLQTVDSNLELGSTTLAGNTTLNTGAGPGNITVGVIAGAGRSLTVNAGTGDISLANAANVIGDLVVTGRNVTIAENEDVTQGAAWNTGTLNVSAPMHDVLLTNSGNTFGTLTLTGDTVEVVEGGFMTVNLITANSLVDLRAMGAIIDANAAALNINAATGTVRLTAVTDIGVGAADILTGTPTNPFEIAAATLLIDAGDDVAVHLTQSTAITALDADLAFITSDASVDLSAATVNVRSLSAVATAGTIALPAALSVAGDLRLDALDIASSSGTHTLSGQRTLFSSQQSEVIALTALTRDATGAPGAIGTDAGQFDARTPGDLSVTNSTAELELADLDASLSSINVGDELTLTANGLVRQVQPASAMQNARVLANTMQLFGSAAFELSHPANDINTLAGNVTGPVTIADVDDLAIGSGSSANGLSIDDEDILLQTGTNLTLSNDLTTGSGQVRLHSNGNVTQSATAAIVASELAVLQSATTGGNVSLTGVNDVDVLALRNLSSNGDSTFRDIDDLIIDRVIGATSAGLSVPTLTGLTGAGGDITITVIGDLTILRSITSRDGVVDSTSATGEQILLQSVNDNIVVDASAGAIELSTDENLLTSNPVTGDSVQLQADSDASYSGDLDGDLIPDTTDNDVDGDGIANDVDPTTDGISEGEVTLLGDITLSTDGGVARRFGPRPMNGDPGTALFVFTSDPLPRVVDNSNAAWANGNAYINAFDIEIGTAGEQNLQLDLDWLDPVNEFGVISNGAIQTAAGSLGIDNLISSERVQRFLVENGGAVNTVGHLYTARDYTIFQTVQRLTTLPIEISVSHHESIGVRSSFLSQLGPAQAVPGADGASTDNVLTGNATFEGGRALFRIPTVTPAPSALFQAASQPRVDRPLSIVPAESARVVDAPSVVEFASGAVSSTAFTTEVYFQIRRQYDIDEPSEIVIERIRDARLISSRSALEKYIRDNPEMQDGPGYEIWLVTDTGGQTIERPIVEFEITAGKPGPASDANLPETLVPENGAEPVTEPILIDVPFEQPQR